MIINKEAMMLDQEQIDKLKNTTKKQPKIDGLVQVIAYNTKHDTLQVQTWHDYQVAEGKIISNDNVLYYVETL